MNIIQLVESLDIGGLPNYVLQLANLQKDAGHNVTVAYVSGTPGAHLETKGLNVVSTPDIKSITDLAPDIVHIHLLSDITLLRDLENSDLKIIRSFHDYTSTCLRRGKRRFPGDRCQRALDYGCAAFGCLIGPPKPNASLRIPSLMNLPQKIEERNIYRRYDAAICGSHHMKNMLLKNGFQDSKTFRIPYFSKFADVAKSGANKEDGAGISRPFRLLFSGQAVTGKGLEVLIEALGSVDGNWHLTVFSEGPRQVHAKTKAQELGILDKITFNGWVEQSALKQAYMDADVFILPSIWDDPGPLVGIEALACGTPVVGFAVGGIPDYVIEGQTGFLVKDVSPQGLRAGIKRALDMNKDISMFTQKCKDHVISTHAPAEHLQLIENVYKEISR